VRRWHGRPCANPHACRGPAGPTTPQFTERNYVGMCASYPPGCARSRGVCAMCVMMEAGVGGWGVAGVHASVCVRARARACPRLRTRVGARRAHRQQVRGARSGGEDTERKVAYARRARAAATRARSRALTAGGALAPSAVSGAPPKSTLHSPSSAAAVGFQRIRER
jgi:hypothetical protein